MIKILAIGKRHEPWVLEGIERYSKRLTGAWKCEWILLPHSAKEGLVARQEESQRILSRLDPADHVVLLDECGTLYDSPGISGVIQAAQNNAKPLVLIIGGAYGVDETLTARANIIWSLSPLVFPHQLVRLIVIEQLYRAQSIAVGHPYHHS